MNILIIKMFYNHALVGNNIISRLVGEVVADSDVYTFKALRYVMPEEQYSHQIISTLDYSIGINEVLLNTTINRSLRKIYDFQLKILKDIEVERSSSPPPTKMTTPTVATSATSWTWIGTEWMTTVNAAKDPDLSKYVTQTIVVVSPTWQTYSTPVTSYNIGDTASYTITASSDSGITYSTTSATLTGEPATSAGLTLDPTTGTISGALTSVNFKYDVSYDYTVRATDADGQYTDAIFRIDISTPPATWIYNTSYTFTWDPSTNQTLGWTSTAFSAALAISGTYTNQTAALSSGGTQVNGEPVFSNTGAASGASLYYNGSTWVIDIIDDANLESVATLRLTGTSTSTIVPTGNYYASNISSDRIGYIS